MSGRILQLDNIEKRFGDTEVLEGINLCVDQGEFITLLGSSGCGKTTTLRIIAGLEQPDGGRVYLGGRDVTGVEPNKRDVNTVFQNYALFPHMSVEANIGYSLRLKRMSKAEIKKEVKEALALVQLEGYDKRLPAELSGGQRQRVAIARAVVNRPKVLLLDEPLGALDLQLRRQMQLELKRLQKRLGITFIYITHDQEEALNMSTRIAVMKDGKFEQIGTPSEIYDHPKTSYVASFVGNANIIKGKAIHCRDGILTFSFSGGVGCVRAEGVQVREGGTVHVAVRSEQIEFNTDQGRGELSAAVHAGGSNGGKMILTDKSFTGGQLRLTIQLPDGSEVIASRHGIDSHIETGEQVWISWSEDSAVLVDREVAN